MIDNLPEKTGKPLAEWFTLLGKKQVEKHSQIMDLLKLDHGVTHGYANMLSILYRQALAGGKPKDEDLITAQYNGPKAALRPIYEQIISSVKEFGSDVEIAPKKTYVSLRRTKQFAIVKAATQKRVDVGLNLKGTEAAERLESGRVFSGMCTHRVRLTSPSDVDSEVISWLKLAYDQSQATSLS